MILGEIVAWATREAINMNRCVKTAEVRRIVCDALVVIGCALVVIGFVTTDLVTTELNNSFNNAHLEANVSLSPSVCREVLGVCR